MKLLTQEYELVSLERLQTHPLNANRGDMAALEASVEANDFYGAVVVQR